MKKLLAPLLSLGAIALVVGLSLAGGSESFAPTVYAENADFTYESFTQEAFEDLKGEENFSVFVHSRSCSTCAKKNKEIIDEVAQFDTGTILKLEYDNATQDFLKKYGVSKHDTFVNFDESGNFETVKGAQVDDVRLTLQ